MGAAAGAVAGVLREHPPGPYLVLAIGLLELVLPVAGLWWLLRGSRP